MILDLARAACLFLHILGFTAWCAGLFWRLIVARLDPQARSDESPKAIQRAAFVFLALEDIGTALIVPSGAALLAFTYIDFSPNIVLAILFVSLCWLAFRRSLWRSPDRPGSIHDFDRALNWLSGLILILAGLANLGNLWAALPPFIGLKIVILGLVFCLREPIRIRRKPAGRAPPAPWRAATSLVLLSAATLLGAWQPLFLISV